MLQEDGDPKKEVLHPIDTLDGSSFLVDDAGEYWRMYDYIEGAKTYDTTDNPEMFYKVGRAFGKFEQRLIDYPADTLYEAIPDFHNTPKRFQDFKKAVKENRAGRIDKEAENYHELITAINMILGHEADINVLEEAKKTGVLPLRVTHNDTKINNVMIDDATGEPICVIDLDTVGPDTALVDYGDAIRSGANQNGEGAKNISGVEMNMDLFKAYTKGFLDETLVTANNSINNDRSKGLTQNEIALMYKAPRILTLELAMRYLGDYLNGDVYFRLKPGKPKDYNFHKALVQLKLAQDMETKETEMKEFIDEYVMKKLKEKMQIKEKEGEER